MATRHSRCGGSAAGAAGAGERSGPRPVHAQTAPAAARAPLGPVCAYRLRDADHTVLHQIVREHLATFLRAAAEHTGGDGLPAFVEREFRDFITCGVWARGFARFRCDTCHAERLVPFSCYLELKTIRSFSPGVLRKTA